jgi:hypothetical protein
MKKKQINDFLKKIELFKDLDSKELELSRSLFKKANSCLNRIILDIIYF